MIQAFFKSGDFMNGGDFSVIRNLDGKFSGDLRSFVFDRQPAFRFPGVVCSGGKHHVFVQ
ncbi:hypothetical protein D3C86_1254370 [compost metagenome]